MDLIFRCFKHIIGGRYTFCEFDILDYIKEKIGRRIALNDVAAATLERKKAVMD
jgi:hypothetical protein